MAEYRCIRCDKILPENYGKYFTYCEKCWNTDFNSLKCKKEYFQAVKSGAKTFELRKNDRDFKVGKKLILLEIDNGVETGNALECEITYILYGGIYGLDKDYCILGIKAK